MAGVVGAVGGLLVGVFFAWWLPQRRYARVGDVTRLVPRCSAVLAVPVVAALCGAIAAMQDSVWFAVGLAVYLAAGVAIVWIDLDVHRIPDRVLAPTVGALLVTTSWGSVTDGPQVWLHAGLGAAGVGLFFVVLAVVGSMGRGDVKLALVTGMMLGPLGWPVVVAAVVAAVLVGALVGVVMLVRGHRGSDHFAFGPAIVAGAALAATWVDLAA